jgi:hypothetical protein
MVVPEFGTGPNCGLERVCPALWCDFQGVTPPVSGVSYQNLQIAPKAGEQCPYPRKKQCASTKGDVHYFMAQDAGHVYCCRRCEKNDEYPER